MEEGNSWRHRLAKNIAAMKRSLVVKIRAKKRRILSSPFLFAVLIAGDLSPPYALY
ncbi:MAG: hypothetical protein ACJA2Q_002043 [Pseudohongiellaceae bacterium]